MFLMMSLSLTLQTGSESTT